MISSVMRLTMSDGIENPTPIDPDGLELELPVEAIAGSDPDWILVMDRDAAVAADEPEYTPAQEVVENAEALRGVTAVQEGHVVYMPEDTYTNEFVAK